ncbi:MAG: DUF3131 domain-containing protein [Elusimicrobia bacterium]|nr:DUF3131 domain-containing protein [Elusimicrobiota bacterium]
MLGNSRSETRRAVRAWVFGWVLIGVATAGPWPAVAAPLSSKDRRYLSGVYRDTWACLAHLVSSATGLPYDSSRRAPSTSTGNTGLYLAACAVAGRTGLVPDPEAKARIEAVLTSLEKWPRFLGGFPETRVNAETLTSTETSFSTVDALSNLTAGLLVVKGIVPDCAVRIDKLLTPMNWGDLYDPDRGLYKGGWNLIKKEFQVQQKGWQWHYGELASESRFGYLWGIGTGAVPLESWGALPHQTETKHGLTYFVPGGAGGLAPALATGIFVDETEAELGWSAAHFVWAQWQNAQRIGAPAWGVSPSESPDGKEFLAYGKITDDVVVPAGSGLAAVYYPRQSADNLRRMEKNGVRAPWNDQGRRRSFGFRDSWDWRTGQVSEVYTCANQAMMFLSLANVLHDGMVWKSVAADPHIQRAIREIPDYGHRDPSLMELFAERDAQSFKEPPKKKKLKGATHGF